MSRAAGFDPRLTPARTDLAAAHLKGKVEAERFVEGVRMRVTAPKAPLRRSPAPDAALDTEALHGERVTVYETSDEGWCWAQLEADSYVGWVPASALGKPAKEPTHRVSALRTLVFAGPNIKRPPLMALPFLSRVALATKEGEFVVTDDGGYISASHLMPVDAIDSDFIATARRFIGAPYLWGGRTNLGLDCSGLVQIALQAAGYDCPRDSDMQAGFGSQVDFSGGLGESRAGDLVYWKGHIGIVSEPGRLLHANGFHMAVAEEPLADAVKRIRNSGSEVLAVRRLGQ
jgi:cell wall-associated NlpC family hydrolase